MTNDRIHARHPDASKTGVNISRAKYEAVRDAILATLREQGDVPFGDLARHVGQRLPDFDGSIGWYTTTVKLDLEARDAIERVPRVTPQVVRLKQV